MNQSYLPPLRSNGLARGPPPIAPLGTRTAGLGRTERAEHQAVTLQNATDLIPQ